MFLKLNLRKTLKIARFNDNDLDVSILISIRK